MIAECKHDPPRVERQVGMHDRARRQLALQERPFPRLILPRIEHDQPWPGRL